MLNNKTIFHKKKWFDCAKEGIPELNPIPSVLSAVRSFSSQINLGPILRLEDGKNKT
jgi:hypothetical protein